MSTWLLNDPLFNQENPARYPFSKNPYEGPVALLCKSKKDALGFFILHTHAAFKLKKRVFNFSKALTVTKLELNFYLLALKKIALTVNHIAALNIA